MKNTAEQVGIYCKQLLKESKKRGFARNGMETIIARIEKPRICPQRGTGIYGQISIIDVFPVTRNGAEGRLSCGIMAF